MKSRNTRIRIIEAMGNGNSRPERRGTDCCWTAMIRTPTCPGSVEGEDIEVIELSLIEAMNVIASKRTDSHQTIFKTLIYKDYMRGIDDRTANFLKCLKTENLAVVISPVNHYRDLIAFWIIASRMPPCSCPA